MRISLKQFIIENSGNTTIKAIEEEIIKTGFEPLRWAIVKVDDSKLTIDAVLISK